MAYKELGGIHTHTHTHTHMACKQLLQESGEEWVIILAEIVRKAL